ncbi:MAG: 6,7-dimethyl-8-ribityllumazine synthase [Bacteroidia bacterium]|nr:MAG: 6,7-dimethyl-8-ribityllumazine synthase [Bacteroidia bacterium]
MAAKQKNLSSFADQSLPDGDDLLFAIVVSDWNSEITDALYNGAMETLRANGVGENNVTTVRVPGSFELPQAAAMLAETQSLNAIICIGCVIQGETRHFEFISQAVAQNCMKVAIDYLTPVIFGVLTTDTVEQAKERAGGKHGNKGVEAAAAALRMANLKDIMIPDDFDSFDPFDEPW